MTAGPCWSVKCRQQFRPSSIIYSKSLRHPKFRPTMLAVIFVGRRVYVGRQCWPVWRGLAAAFVYREYGHNETTRISESYLWQQAYMVAPKRIEQNSIVRNGKSECIVLLKLTDMKHRAASLREQSFLFHFAVKRRGGRCDPQWSTEKMTSLDMPVLYQNPDERWRYCEINNDVLNESETLQMTLNSARRQVLPPDEWHLKNSHVPD